MPKTERSLKVNVMAYETKVLLIGIADYIDAVKENSTPEEKKALRKVYEHIARMANAEGVVLKPFDEIK